MAFVYITGVAGSGKSVIRDELHKRSFVVYDEDEPGIGSAYDIATGEPVAIPEASARTQEWFSNHEWKVHSSALASLESRAKEQLVILCGNSLKEDDALQLFDKVIYLKIDVATASHRIKFRSDNDYGKTDLELQTVLSRIPVMDRTYDKSNSCIIDASKPLSEVLADMLRAIETV